MEQHPVGIATCGFLIFCRCSLKLLTCFHPKLVSLWSTRQPPYFVTLQKAVPWRIKNMSFLQHFTCGTLDKEINSGAWIDGSISGLMFLLGDTWNLFLAPSYSVKTVSSPGPHLYLELFLVEVGRLSFAPVALWLRTFFTLPTQLVDHMWHLCLRESSKG